MAGLRQYYDKGGLNLGQTSAAFINLIRSSAFIGCPTQHSPFKFDLHGLDYNQA